MFKKLIDYILDLSIYKSFDKSGFYRHIPEYETYKYEFPNNSCALVTGGTSGIGQACVEVLGNKNVRTFFTGRNVERGHNVSEKNKNSFFLRSDLADWNSIEDTVLSIDEPLNFVILNAGGMPEKFKTNAYGVELQFASQLFGHYYLLKQLQKHKKLAANAKIVWVSSGGMYLKTLENKNIFTNNDYNKVSSYANVKRSQVVLLDYFKKEFADYTVVGMHPGWVATAGVKNSINKFYKKMKDNLREPIEGADTILWLLEEKTKLETGEFYFDRKKASKNFLFFNRNHKKVKNMLIKDLNKYYLQLKK